MEASVVAAAGREGTVVRSSRVENGVNVGGEETGARAKIECGVHRQGGGTASKASEMAITKIK